MIGFAIALYGLKPDEGGRIKRTGHPLEPVYAGMLRRCLNPNEPLYHRYGGRGISVCQRWRAPNGQGFANFCLDMGARVKGHSLDRIDNNGNYLARNYRWADRSTQARNKSNCVWVTYQDQHVLLRDLAESVGKDRRTIAWRLAKGLPIEDAISSDDRHDNAYHRMRKTRREAV